MPEEGHTVHGRDIGKKPSNALFEYRICPQCRKGRYARLHYHGMRLCRHCAAVRNNGSRYLKGESNPNWQGGKLECKGYIRVRLSSDDFFFSMTNNSYVLEHRLVMAHHLGRLLQPWELVHHKNGIKTDNRLENLELGGWGSHSREHNRGYRSGYQQGLVDGRFKQIEDLRQQIRLLQVQNHELLSLARGLKLTVPEAT